MQRIRAAYIAASAWLLAAAGAAAAPVGHYPTGVFEDGAQGRANIVYALEHIPTPVGTSALQRMNACRFRVDWLGSSVSRLQVANPAFGLNAGDIMIEIMFDRPDPNPYMARDNLARWLVTGGKPKPITPWAKLIQLGPYPINKGGQTHC
jgi:hypothetical protein